MFYPIFKHCVTSNKSAAYTCISYASLISRSTILLLFSSIEMPNNRNYIDRNITKEKLV